MKSTVNKLKNLSYRAKGWIYYAIAATAYVLEDAAFAGEFYFQLIMGFALIFGFVAAGRNWILADIHTGIFTPKLPKNQEIVNNPESYYDKW